MPAVNTHVYEYFTPLVKANTGMVHMYVYMHVHIHIYMYVHHIERRGGRCPLVKAYVAYCSVPFCVLLNVHVIGTLFMTHLLKDLHVYRSVFGDRERIGV